MRDRRAHIGIAKLRQHRPIDKVDQRMNHALRMHDYLYPVFRETEQPAGFYDLETLVHHRCRIDRYLCAHIPAQAIARGMQKWPAGCRQQYLAHPRQRRVRIVREALKNRIVLTVNRDNFRTTLLHGGCK